MARLIAYADESGIHNNPGYCILSGFVASEHRWALFAHDWQDVIKAYDVVPFHARVFFKRSPDSKRNPYREWNDYGRLQYVRALLDVFKRHESRLTPIGSAIEVEAFEQLSKGQRRYLTGGIINWHTMKWERSGSWSRPYFLAFNQLIVDALRQTDSGSTVNLILDKQETFESLATSSFNEMKAPGGLNGQENRLGELSFQGSADFPALQLADMWNFSWYNYATERRTGLRAYIMRRLAENYDKLPLQTSERFNQLFDHALTPDQRKLLRGMNE